jgi:hypothetical protein
MEEASDCVIYDDDDSDTIIIKKDTDGTERGTQPKTSLFHRFSFFLLFFMIGRVLLGGETRSIHSYIHSYIHSRALCYSSISNSSFVRVQAA